MRDDACRRVFRRLPMNDCPENMAENIESVIVKVEEDEALQQAVKVNGRYVDPWGTARMPSKVDVLRWRLLEKNERGIGGTWRELFRFKHEVQNKCRSVHVIYWSNYFKFKLSIKSILCLLPSTQG